VGSYYSGPCCWIWNRAIFPSLVFMREWYMHPSGALPAYEWNFDDLNPRKEGGGRRN